MVVEKNGVTFKLDDPVMIEAFLNSGWIEIVEKPEPGLTPGPKPKAARKQPQRSSGDKPKIETGE